MKRVTSYTTLSIITHAESGVLWDFTSSQVYFPHTFSAPAPPKEGAWAVDAVLLGGIARSSLSLFLLLSSPPPPLFLR